MNNTIAVEAYNPVWPTLFEEEKARIVALIGPYLEDMQHVGSTAVAGLAAKPIIDILAGVHSLDNVPHCVGPLESLGYEYLGEYGIPKRHYFRKPALPITQQPRTHHIHMVERGHWEGEKLLLFRDYLRAHPETAEEYARLKHNLAVRYRDNREAYTDGKTDFVRSVLAKARRDARGG